MDSTAPGPVTALRTTAVTPASVALAWTNPTDTDFAGVTIRREDGATPPLSVSDGMAIADLSSAASTFTDATVSGGIRYSYAVFAHDGIPNAAAAATLTVTAHNPPSAQLAGPARLTVDQQNRSTRVVQAPTTASRWCRPFLISAPVRRRFFTGAPATWQAAHTYQDVGADVATLTVTDSGNLTATIAVPVTVFAAPTASIAPNRPPQVGIPTTFEATVSTPPGTAFTHSQISYDNGATFESFEGSEWPTLTHTFVKEETLTVVFKAWNDADGIADASVQISVSGLTE